VRVRIGWIGGAVIALEVVRMGRRWRISGHTFRRK
jgi:hypothetical protein